MFASDFVVFIGRFQPFHRGHERVVREGLKNAPIVILLVGSADRARTTRDPWSFEERCAMIRGAFTDAERARLRFAPLPDSLYNDDTWTEDVQRAVLRIVNDSAAPNQNARISLIGYSKDHSSYYLKLFPQWGSINVSGEGILNATDVRKALFSNEESNVRSLVPPAVADWLMRFGKTESFRELQDEERFILSYKAGWKDAPYAPTFVTVDAVVTQSGHLLLVKRDTRPGRGQWALPGGFIHSHERLLDGCVRRLHEETRIKVPEPVLRGSLTASHVFDDPHRSNRGRTITHAFHFALRAQEELPKLRSGEQVSLARWLPFSSVRSCDLFEDHYFIFRHFVGANIA